MHRAVGGGGECSRAGVHRCSGRSGEDSLRSPLLGTADPVGMSFKFTIHVVTLLKISARLYKKLKNVSFLALYHPVVDLLKVTKWNRRVTY